MFRTCNQVTYVEQPRDDAAPCPVVLSDRIVQLRRRQNVLLQRGGDNRPIEEYQQCLVLQYASHQQIHSLLLPPFPPPYNNGVSLCNKRCYSVTRLLFQACPLPRSQPPSLPEEEGWHTLFAHACNTVDRENFAVK